MPKKKSSNNKKKNKPKTKSATSTTAAATNQNEKISNANTDAKPPIRFAYNREQPSIEPGRKVRVHNLKNRTDLNGMLGIILPSGLDEKTGRVAVKVMLGSGAEHTQSVMVKPENLEVCWNVPNNINALGEEAEECPICMDTVMYTAVNENQNASFLTCCGTKICHKCTMKVLQGPDPDTCPICRADTSDTRPEKMIQDLTRRANQGHAPSQYNLACAYDYGNTGVRQDQAKARVLYKLAADQKHARAASNLACSYRDAEGGPRDYKMAVHYFRVAAELGHVKSQTNLGLLYLQGHGVERDLKEARHWLTLGANAGDELARNKLQTLEMMEAFSSFKGFG